MQRASGGLAPTRAHPLHPAIPCHYIFRDAAPPPDDGAVGIQMGQGAVRDVVARGGVGGGWALVGARCGTTPNVSGTETAPWSADTQIRPHHVLYWADGTHLGVSFGELATCLNRSGGVLSLCCVLRLWCFIWKTRWRTVSPWQKRYSQRSCLASYLNRRYSAFASGRHQSNPVFPCLDSLIFFQG